MGTHTVQHLMSLWSREKVDLDHIMGQVLQYIIALQDAVEALELEVRKLKRQVKELSSEK